jgi:hypothetical protein
MVGMRESRRYAIYVSETQEQADKHVGTIAALLESANIERAVNKYGSSRGWRRNRLRAANGFTIDALGLDTASRGIKVEEARPDLIVLDDIDARHDSPLEIQKKTETLTTTVLPTGSNDCAVLAVQNLIHGKSIFASLANGTADFLADRIVSGPHKAVNNLVYELKDGTVTITGGEATWSGQSISDCQNFIKTWGIRAFLRECQHDVADTEGALWTREIIDATRLAQAPPLTRIAVGVDPQASSRTGSAETGIVANGIGNCRCRGTDEEHLFILADDSMSGRPHEWATASVACFSKVQADTLVAEVNQGGEMVAETIQVVAPNLPISQVHASRNKQARAEPVATLFEEHRAHIVGYLPELENQLCQWSPQSGMPSPDHLDAMVWAAVELMPSLMGSPRDEDDEKKPDSRWTPNVNYANVGGGGSRWRR